MRPVVTRAFQFLLSITLLGLLTSCLRFVPPKERFVATKRLPPRSTVYEYVNLDKGPSNLVRSYWKTVAGLRPRPSPQPGPGVGYLSFEPWNGGWNNRRMSVENAFILAHLTNRTLILPPKLNAAQLDGGMTGYEDFFDLFDMRLAVPTMTYKDFLEVTPQLLNGNMPNKSIDQCDKWKHPQSKGYCESFGYVREAMPHANVRSDFGLGAGCAGDT